MAAGRRLRDVRDRSIASDDGQLRSRRRSFMGQRLSAACRTGTHLSFARPPVLGMVTLPKAKVRALAVEVWTCRSVRVMRVMHTMLVISTRTRGFEPCVSCLSCELYNVRQFRRAATQSGKKQPDHLATPSPAGSPSRSQPSHHAHAGPSPAIPIEHDSKQRHFHGQVRRFAHDKPDRLRALPCLLLGPTLYRRR